MNSEDGQVYSVCILQFSCFTKYNRRQSKHEQIKELFKKTISNSSLNSHVYWDTLYHVQTVSPFYPFKIEIKIVFKVNVL